MVTKGAILHSCYWRYHLLQEGLCVYACLRDKKVISHFFSWNVQIINLCSTRKRVQLLQGDEGGGSICGGMSSPGRLKYLARRTLEQCFLAEAFLRLERGGKLAVPPSSSSSSSSSHGTFVFLPWITLTVAGASSLHGVLNQIVSQAVGRGRKKKGTRGPDTSDTEKEEKGFGQSCSSSAQHESNEAAKKKKISGEEYERETDWGAGAKKSWGRR